MKTGFVSAVAALAILFTLSAAQAVTLKTENFDNDPGWGSSSDGTHFLVDYSGSTNLAGGSVGEAGFQNARPGEGEFGPARYYADTNIGTLTASDPMQASFLFATAGSGTEIHIGFFNTNANLNGASTDPNKAFIGVQADLNRWAASMKGPFGENVQFLTGGPDVVGPHPISFSYHPTDGDGVLSIDIDGTTRTAALSASQRAALDGGPGFNAFGIAPLPDAPAGFRPAVIGLDNAEYTLIPEPASLVLALVAGSMLLMRRRR